MTPDKKPKEVKEWYLPSSSRHYSIEVETTEHLDQFIERRAAEGNPLSLGEFLRLEHQQRRYFLKQWMLWGGWTALALGWAWLASYNLLFIIPALACLGISFYYIGKALPDDPSEVK